MRTDDSVAPADAIALAERALDDGSALERFRLMVQAQGGDPRVIERTGGVVVAADAASTYGVTDDGGRRPVPLTLATV